MTSASGSVVPGAAAPLPAGLAAQPRAARTLQKMMAERSAHAFMLSGPRGAGTVEAASWIARSVLCSRGGCGECDVCARVDRHVHPDLLWVRAEGINLLTAQIEELLEQLVRTPFEAAAQVAVIDDAETLAVENAAAANRLLKMLEEPTGDVVFVLIASNPDRVLATIRSRVIEVPFVPVPLAALTAIVESWGVGGAMPAAQVARIARGDIGRARELAEGGAAASRRAAVLDVAERMSRGAILPAEAAELLHAPVVAAGEAELERAEREFEAQREMMSKEESRRAKGKGPESDEARAKRRSTRVQADELRLVFDELATWYRDLVLASQGAFDAVVNVDRSDALAQLAGSPAARNAVACIDAIEDLRRVLAQNVNRDVAMNALCAELCSAAEGRVRSRRTIGTVGPIGSIG